MKKSLNHLALTLCLSPLLVQCIAMENDVRGLDMRLRTMDARMTDMDRKVADMDQSLAVAANQRAIQAEMGNQLDQTKSRMLQLEGRLEEQTMALRKLQAALATQKNSTTERANQLQQQINEMEARNRELLTQLAAVSGTFTQLQEEQAREATERAAVAARAAEEARKKAESLASAQTASPADNGPRALEPVQTKKKPEKPEGLVPQSAPEPARPVSLATAVDAESSDPLYNSGLAAYRANKFKEAYSAFSQYLEKNRTGALAANARFWMGDCLFQQKEFELAILEYQKVIADYPKSDKAPAALFKQGAAFENLDEKETAKIIYNKLIADYPKSEQVEQARKKLTGLK
jgi:tol-pal system protein YbgF